MNLSTFFVLLAVILIIGAIIFKMVKDKRTGKGGCGGGCSSCPNSCACHGGVHNHNAQ